MHDAPHIAAIFIGAQSGSAKMPCQHATLIADYGVEGDYHAGKPDSSRQVSLFAQEVWQALQREGFAFAAGELSANLFTLNVALDELPGGTRLQIGEHVLLEIVERRLPCRAITKLNHRLPKRLRNHCGQFARVVQGGTVITGAAIQVIPAQPTMTQ